MRWIITDSGLGGLSVCAGIERYLTHAGNGSGIELLYVNATPEDRFGYNDLKTQSERIELFDQFLNAVTYRFAPDKFILACNTLSAIYKETSFAKRFPIEVNGIIDAGLDLCNSSLLSNPEAGLIIFATETTIEADVYLRFIDAELSKIVTQACPGLAHEISNDASGKVCYKLLKSYVGEALVQFNHKPSSILAFLGCTHYGYQAHLFQTILEDNGFCVSVLNPNDSLVKMVTTKNMVKSQNQARPPRIRLISRYPIPKMEIDTMKQYFSDSAPLTLAALENQIIIPDLYNTS